jgi:uncharacterized protein YfiM (DUF2279 family)
MKRLLRLEYELIFRYIFLLAIIGTIIQSGNSLSADDQPDALKSYFRSFGKEKKPERQDLWFSPDKGYHVLGSMIGTTLVGQISMKRFDYSIKKSQLITAGTAFTIGFTKEIYDSEQPKNYFSWKDLAANGVGIIIGIIILGMH